MTDVSTPNPEATPPEGEPVMPAANMPGALAETPDGLPTPRRYWAAAAVWCAIAMAVMDSAIANVALPTIARDVGATPAASIWVINAYQIAITMALLPVAALGERLGYRRIYMVGLALFVAASLGCALAHDLTTLALARFVQGFGAAGVMAINGALVRFIYPRARLGRGIGYNALVVAIASAAGPSIAAAILAIGHWQWLFAVNVPPGLVALAIGMRCLPAARGAQRPFDYVSAALSAAAFGTLFLALSELSRDAASPAVLLGIPVGIIAGIVLIRRAWRQTAPMMPVDLLRIRLLRLSYMTSALSFAAMMAALVALPFFLQRRFGLDHVATGLFITPLPVAIGIMAPIAGRLVEHVPAGVLGGLGLALLAAGLTAMGLLPEDAPHGAIIACTALCGAGFGLFQTPNNRAMVGDAPAERAGAAAGMLATSRLVGQTIGAVMVAFLFRILSPDTRVTFLLAAGLAVAGALVSVSRAAGGRVSSHAA